MFTAAATTTELGEPPVMTNRKMAAQAGKASSGEQKT
jgi:hypothetical protein